MFKKNIFEDAYKNKKIDKEKIYTWAEDDDADFDALDYLQKLKECEKDMVIDKVRIEIELFRKF